jgi:serine phosphatase RsbU (regulator of sigma subunit)/anti-sigma regulatory factor (Ser/Thr protein kinase)
VVGGLFLSSTQPYALTADDLALAGALAAQAAQALERARLYAAERQVSVTLQRSLLPPELPEVDGVDFELRYLPAAGLEAGGDFYEALELPDGTVLFACGDVVGRGATAAAAMGQLRSALRAFALMGGGPSEILSRLSTFADTIDSAMAATAAVGKLDPASGELRYACAGHPWPLLVHPDARAEYLTEGRGVPLGCVPRPDYPEATVTLERGSTLVLYTDGLTERRDEDVAVVLERLRSVAAASAVEPLAELLDSAVAVAGVSTRADDIALVGLRLTERGASTLQLSFPGELDQVPLARAAVRTWLAEHGVGGAIAADLLLAAGEAFANAVEHSGSETVDLELTRPAARQVAIVVRDRGAWRVPPDETDRGRGFGLMRALVDECTIDHSDDGTVVRLRRAVDPVAGLPPAVGGACTVRFERDRAFVEGDLDLGAAEGIGLELRPARVIDLTGVTYLDSTGARTLIGIAGAAIIAPVGSVARRTLDLSGLTGMLDVRDS